MVLRWRLVLRLVQGQAVHWNLIVSVRSRGMQSLKSPHKYRCTSTGERLCVQVQSVKTRGCCRDYKQLIYLCTIQLYCAHTDTISFTFTHFSLNSLETIVMSYTAIQWTPLTLAELKRMDAVSNVCNNVHHHDCHQNTKKCYPIVSEMHTSYANHVNTDLTFLCR